MRHLASMGTWRWAATLVVALVTGMVLYKASLSGGLTRFGGFGEKFSVNYIQSVFDAGAYVRPNSGGYDGQFYAQIATDPTLSDPDFQKAMDEPAYRSRRILLPLIAHLLAFGDAHRAIHIYCGLNILLWFGFAWFIWSWLKVDNARDFTRWVSCVLSMGIMDSMKYSLTDLPSMFAILLMIRYATTRPLGTAAGFLATVFLKETNLLSLAALPNFDKKPKDLIWDTLRWGIVGALTVTVFFLWYRYINEKFGVFHGVSGNFDWPFSSMIRGGIAAGIEVLSGNWDDRFIFRILAIVGFLFQFVWLLTQTKNFKDPLIRLGLVYGVLFVFLGDLVWWGYWAVCRVALPMTIVFNLRYAPKRYFWLGMFLANLTVIHSIYRFI